MAYNRYQAVAYAHQWAFKRNPAYYDFSEIGGDCTNFVSQCIYAGGAPMNYTETFGWYYRNTNDRTPSWAGVQYFYDFLKSNKGIGPYAEVTGLSSLEPGDVVQLSFIPGKFSHTLLVVQNGMFMNHMNNVLIATHTDDSNNRPLSSYFNAVEFRFLKIFVRDAVTS